MTRSIYRNALKKFKTLIAQNDPKEAEKTLPYVFKTLDTAAKKNVISDNKAARHKSAAAKALDHLIKNPVATEPKVKKVKVEKAAKAPKKVKAEKPAKATKAAKK